MAQSNKIKNSWSLLSFAREFGPKMQVGEFVNSESGDKFKSCIFTKGDTRTFVAFSSKLGVLSPGEIAAQKDDLQVVLCETKDGDDMYSLCHQGQDSWEDVDLGL
ncbi:hypothetical protein [Prevotella sp.]|nr:hypothetical protein [Prevotella sp.]